MARPHLRIQSGGHPSQGPVREMANPSPSPGVGEDFPDAPDETRDDRPEDQPDLDAFAAKLGLDASADDGATDDRSTDDGRSFVRNARRTASDVADRAASGLASGLGWLAQRLQSASSRLADRARD